MEQGHGSFRRKVYLLGVFRVYREGQLCALSGEKTQALLAYLVLHPRLPQPREKLADLFYPEAPFERVRRNLSDTLYRLQKALGGDWFMIERDTVALRLDERLWVDVWEFERLAGSDQEGDLQKAVDLYGGDLLPELYDDWILSERELHRNQYLTMLENLAAAQETSGKLQQALLSWRRLITAEPLHEPAHQAYLRLLGRLQRYGEALAHYEYLKTLMRSELDVEPLAETRLVAQLIERERDLATVQTLVEERTPFTGRRAERAAALAFVEGMLKGQGMILAIEGEAGIGKSRLLRELAAGVRWRGATLLQGTASETPGASPFTPLTNALAPLINSPRGAQIETIIQDMTLATLSPLHPAWEKKASLDEAPPEVAADRFYDALRIFGESIARLTPLVLALDDLQWADMALWKSLEALALGLVKGGGLLISIYRRPDIEGTAGWEVVQSWDRAGILKTIALQPFSTEEVSQLVQDENQIDPIELHAWTAGNPFLILEWLTTPQANKSTSNNLAANRLHALSPNARLALESASILGESIPFQFWTEISRLSSPSLASISDELVANRWLQPSPAGYTFEHDLLRKAVYEGIEPAHRQTLHARAAGAYMNLEPDNWRARAFHYDQAGAAEEAARAYKLAGEHDLTRYAFQEAQNAFERALTLLPKNPTTERVELDLLLANACETTGDYQRRRAVLGEALAEAHHLKNGDLLLRALLALGRVEGLRSQFKEAKSYLNEAITLARELGDRIREIEAIYELGLVAARQGQWDEANRYYEQSLELSRLISQEQSAESGFDEAGARRRQEAARTLERIEKAIASSIDLQIGTLPEKARLYEQELASQRQKGDRADELLAQIRLLGAYYYLGAWDPLLSTAEEALSLAEAVGDRFKMATVQHTLGLALNAMGDRTKARSLLVQAEKGFEATGQLPSAGLSCNALGLVAEDDGNHEEALHLYRTALDGARARQTALEEAYAMHDLGAFLLKLDRFSEAISLLDGARATWLEQGNTLQRLKSEAYLGLGLLETRERRRAEELARNGLAAFRSGVPVGELPQAWLWALSRLLAGLGQPNPAAEVLRAAYGELERQSRTLGDPQLRRSFFQNIPLNREIVRAYDQIARNLRVISVLLARRDVPLGRTLNKDEYIKVQWTLSAPEDDAIAGKSKRRRYRLKRLLNEAEGQGAAPTDDDLAQALQVSRRTILRDMQALAHEIPRPPTRKRKR
jgi:DNA-binding SARP family transcriptional activator/Tfp pilus assembly protein PilF